jgi:hypothetical protein
LGTQIAFRLRKRASGDVRTRGCDEGFAADPVLARRGVLAGARTLLDVGEEESGEFLIGSGVAMIVATSAWGLALGSFAFHG